MKTLPLLLLLFLGGLVFFGCKKKNDSLPISAYTGTYLVSGTARTVRPHAYGDPNGTLNYYEVTLTDDSLFISSSGSLLRTVSFADRICGSCYSFNTPALSVGNGSCLPYNDPALYYNFFYELPCPSPPIPPTGYTLSYQRNNVDTIYVHAAFDGDEIFLSGVKVHQ